MTNYDKRWFAGQVGTAGSSAERVVPLLIDLVKPRSVVDVGCGLGAWAAEFLKQGVADVRGIDGDYVDRGMLKIPADKFEAKDLSKPLTIDRKFDLALSVEVAEHLPESVADSFVKALTDAAPVVAFSAALPGQGGNHHINEQWVSYWAKKFAARGYGAADVVRPVVWEDGQVEWWYRQNLVVYVSAAAAAANPRLAKAVEESKGRPLDLVHPAMFEVVRARSENPAASLAQDMTLAAKQAARKIVPRK